MCSTVVRPAARVSACIVVLTLACFADVHVVVLAQGKLCGHEALVTLLGAFPGCGLHLACSVCSDDKCPFLELEAGAIKFQNRRDDRVVDRVLQIAVLLPVKIDRVESIHGVEHVLAEVLKVALELIGAIGYDVLNKEGEVRLLLRGCDVRDHDADEVY